MFYKDLLAEWWRGYRITLAPITQHKKEEEMRVHILPALGGKDVAQITSGDLQDFIALLFGKDYRGGGLSPSMAQNLFKIIRPTLSYAAKHGYIPSSPMDDVRLPPISYREVRVFTAAEVKLLIAAARPAWLADMILLAYRTGMRRGEVYGLKWADLDFDGATLMVRRMVGAYEPRQRYVHPPKTRKSARVIALDMATVEMLRRRQQAAAGEWVFPAPDGGPRSPWYMTKYMAGACKAAGIPHRSFHILRHTHATLLLAAGVNPRIVQERLGHSNLSMTLGTYYHYLPSMQAAAVEVLDRLA